MDSGEKAARSVAAAFAGAGPSGARDGSVFGGRFSRAGKDRCGDWKFARDGGAGVSWARDLCGRKRPRIRECGEAGEFWAGVCAGGIDNAGCKRQSDGVESVSVGDGRVGGDCAEGSEGRGGRGAGAGTAGEIGGRFSEWAGEWN